MIFKNVPSAGKTTTVCFIIFNKTKIHLQTSSCIGWQVVLQSWLSFTGIFFEDLGILVK